MPAVVEKRMPLEFPDVRLAANNVVASERVHYLDNLRAWAMMLGVFLHGAFAYANPAQSFWLATDPQSSVVIDAAIWFVHLFRMGLFFLISGYFAKFVLMRHGIKRFLWQRTLRLVFPFLLFYPLLLAAMSLLIAFGLSYVDQPRGLMGLIAEASRSGSGMVLGAKSGPAPGTMHLWFLYYLIFFTGIGAAAFRCSWFSWGEPRQRPWILAVAPLILLPGIIGSGVPLPGPESFVPTWWPFAYYGVFYWSGWHLYGREGQLESLQSYKWHIVGGSLLLFVLYYWSMPYLDLASLIKAPPTLPLWRQGLLALLTAYLSVSLTAAALLLGMHFMSRPSATLRFTADASYWVYLVHLPVVLFLQTLLIAVSWNVWLKLSITLAGTTFFCLSTYVVFIRYTPVGWLLHGPRSFP